MESGHKRSPFAAGGDIAAAEIAHDVKARKFCNECRVVELQCPALFGTMPNCLTVNADGGNVLSADVGHVEQLIDAMHVELAEFHGSGAHAINFIVAGLTQRKKLFLERLRKFPEKSTATASTPSRLVPDIKPRVTVLAMVENLRFGLGKGVF